MNTKLKKIAAAGTFCLIACSSASAGWLCNWTGANNRPYYDPSNEPNWGVQETTWRRFASHSNYGQGSYCATGQCQPGMSAQYSDGMGMGVAGPVQQGPAQSMQGMLIQQAPAQQQQVIQLPQAVPQTQMIQPPLLGQPLQIPNQQQGSIFAPPEITPYQQPMNNAPLGNSMQGGALPPGSHSPQMNSIPSMPAQPGGNAVPLMAPQPQMPDSPQPMNNGGTLPVPDTTLNPRTMNDGGLANPVPFPKPDAALPPMTQSDFYRSPFNRAAPGNAITNPVANYGYQQQAGVQAQPISYQSGQYPSQQTQPAPSRNPFSLMSRMWKRGK